MIEEMDRFMLDSGFAKEGDVIVLVAGHPIAAKEQNELHETAQGGGEDRLNRLNR